MGSRGRTSSQLLCELLRVWLPLQRHVLCLFVQLLFGNELMRKRIVNEHDIIREPAVSI